MNQAFSVPSYTLTPGMKALFFVLFVWSVVWKLVALWKAAKHGQKGWFIGLYLLNVIGIPEMIYLGFFQKGEKNIIQRWKERRASKSSHNKVKE
jgi:hypothetical protein